jgi:hypothetical protein
MLRDYDRVLGEESMDWFGWPNKWVGICAWLMLGLLIFYKHSGTASSISAEASKSAAVISGNAVQTPAAEAMPIAEKKTDPEAKTPQTNGSIYRMTAQSFGCKDAQFLERLLTYASDGDDKAFLEFAAVSVAAGECIRMKKGHQVFIEEDRDVIKKVRPKGEHLFYWVIGGQVKADDTPAKKSGR